MPNAALSPPEWFCITMGSDVSRLNVSLIAGSKVRRLCP